MTDIGKIARLYEKSLSSDLELARATFNHNGQKGTSLERSIQALLIRFLPDTCAVAEGIIIDSSGFVSSQLDIIIYDKSAAQLFYKSDSSIVVPVEYVFAIVEVKAQLNKAGYDAFFQTQREVKNASKQFLRHENKARFRYHGYGRDWTNPQIASLLVCFDAEPQIYELAKKSHQEYPVNQCIDSIFCPMKFSIHRESENGPDLMQGTMQRLMKINEKSMFFFLGNLAKAAATWRMLEPVAIYRYFQTEGVPGSSLTPIDGSKISGKDLID